MYKYALILFLLFSLSNASYFENGKNEIGGTIGYNNIINSSGGLTFYQFSPFYNHYFNNYFGIGPILSYSQVDYNAINFNGHFYSEIDLGLRIINGSQIYNSFVYLSYGACFVSLSNPIAYGNFEQTFGIPVEVGCKTIITKHFGIVYNIGDKYILSKHNVTNNIGITIGLFGLF